MFVASRGPSHIRVALTSALCLLGDELHRGGSSPELGGPGWLVSSVAVLDTPRKVTEERETIATLTKARSLLTLLIATCKETLLALEAAANVLDTQLTDDLRLMIERSEEELRVLSEKLAALRAAST